MNVKTLKVLAALCMLAGFSSAHADFVVYSYQGNPFTMYGGLYAGSDAVTAQLTLTSPLVAAPGIIVHAALQPGFMLSMQDGVQTLNQNPFADVELDSSGNISNWEVTAYTTAAPLASIFTASDIYKWGSVTLNIDQAVDGSASTGEILSNPGTWTKACYTDVGIPITCPLYPIQIFQLLNRLVIGVGPGDSLRHKLRRAQSDYEDDDIGATCRVLHRFVHEVNAQTGEIIPPGVAETLVTNAEEIQMELSCPSEAGP